MDTSYDEVPWAGLAIPGTAPEQLALASWFQEGPRPPVERPTYLEIGCGDGANLLPLAAHRPDAHFVGLDASAVLVRRAQLACDALGLTNLTFRLEDLTDADLGAHRFDYIVAHGVLSWVAPPVRDALLDVVRRHLAPDGVAMISHNVAAGWMARGAVRDLLLRSDVPADPTPSRVEAARSLAGRLAELMAARPDPRSTLLAAELARAANARDQDLVHEYLAEHNRAFWASEFDALLDAHNLRRIGDARFHKADGAAERALRSQVAPLQPCGLAVDDLVDFAGARRFAYPILCHADAPPAMTTAPFTVATGLARARDEFDFTDGVTETFRGSDGFEVRAADSATKAALIHLAAIWPEGRSLDVLAQEAQALLHRAGIPDATIDIDALTRTAMGLFRASQLELRLREPRCRVHPSDPPVALPIARAEAGEGRPLTTPHHTGLPLPPAASALVTALDGRTLEAAVAEVPDLGVAEATAIVRQLGWWGLLEPARDRTA